MPFVQRADGSYMKETVPIARYIARVHGYFPADVLEAFRCDWIVQLYQPIINGMDANIFMTGSKKTENQWDVTKNLLPNFFKSIEEYTKEGWLIGDGSKIYMCDFFVGSIFTDLMQNETSWMSKEMKKHIMDTCPNYCAYGMRFVEENKTWIDKRNKQFSKP